MGHIYIYSKVTKITRKKEAAHFAEKAGENTELQGKEKIKLATFAKKKLYSVPPKMSLWSCNKKYLVFPQRYFQF